MSTKLELAFKEGASILGSITRYNEMLLSSLNEAPLDVRAKNKDENEEDSDGYGEGEYLDSSTVEREYEDILAEHSLPKANKAESSRAGVVVCPLCLTNPYSSRGFKGTPEEIKHHLRHFDHDAEFQTGIIKMYFSHCVRADEEGNTTVICPVKNCEWIHIDEEGCSSDSEGGNEKYLYGAFETHIESNHGEDFFSDDVAIRSLKQFMGFSQGSGSDKDEDNANKLEDDGGYEDDGDEDSEAEGDVAEVER